MSPHPANEPARDTSNPTPKTGGRRKTFQYWVDSPGPGDKACTPFEIHLRGWMFSLEGKRMHGTASVEGMPDVPFTAAMNRPDVVQHFAEKGQAVTDPCGFELYIPLPQDGKSTVVLTLAFSDGDFTTAPQSYTVDRAATTLLWPPPPLRSTIIAHFYNEEYLLPLWLRHHLEIFDHGILINRGSTDRSVEICRQLAPHWEIRNATCLEFDAEEVDREVMAIERELTGWKMALNITEFLHVQSKESFFSALQSYGRRAYGVCMALLIEPEEAAYPEFDTSRPLAAQRHHGVVQNSFGGVRYVHNHADGLYGVGRHYTAHPMEIFPRGGAIILKTFLCPWNATFKRRRLQIHSTISQRSKGYNYGYHHVATEEELEILYRTHVGTTTDLRETHDLEWLYGKPATQCLVTSRNQASVAETQISSTACL